MAPEMYLIILVVGFVALYLIVPRVAGNYLKYRGERVIICPETRKPARVVVQAAHAAFTATTGEPELRLKSCSRWPERQDCGQDCLLQVELAPEDCLLSNMLVNWYADKQCVSCGRQFGKIHLFDHKPAMVGPDGKTVAWEELAAERVPEMLTTHSPLCWDCFITRTFCREHPERVVDRSGISAGVHRETMAN
jgi:hypothetical protein